MDEPAIGWLALVGAEGLGDEAVEAEEDAGDAEAEGVVEMLGESRGAHGEGGVGQMAEHDGVDQGHGDPAELACDEREREAEQRREFAANEAESQRHR